MKLYDENKPFHLETDAAGVGLGTVLLKMTGGAPDQRDSKPGNITL